MKVCAAILTALLLAAAATAAQEEKPVPKDSVRVAIPGCSKDYVFTTVTRTSDDTTTAIFPAGTHLRMNGPKKLLAEIKGHQGSLIEITGIVKKGQYVDGGGVKVGGVRISPGSPPVAGGGGSLGSPAAGQTMIDVEGWRALLGDCPFKVK